MGRGIYLTDFGLARWGSKLTRTGETPGTPAYMSPEQLRGDAALAPAADLWALGCVLYECLAGRRAFEAADVASALAHVQRPAPRLPATAGHAPAALRALVAAMLARAPADRPPTAAVRDDLARLRRGEPAAWRAPRRGRRRLAAVALLLLAGAAVALAIAGRGRAGQPGAADPAALEAERGWAWRQDDPAAGAALLARTLAARPERHAWRLQLGLLRWATGDGPGAVAAWDAVPDDAPEAPWARLYAVFEPLFGEDLDGDGLRWREAAARADTLPTSGTPGVLGRAVRALLAREPGVARATLDGAAGWEAALLRALAEEIAPDGDPRSGRRAYDQALAEGIAFGWAHYNRGLLRKRLGDLPGALADIEAALERTPGDAGARMMRGVVRAALGDLPGALRDLDAAVAARPASARILGNRGSLRAQSGDLTGALADFDAALARAPRDADTRVNRAIAKEQLGDAAGARADCDAALAVEPGSATALAFRAKLRLQAGDPAGARTDAAAALARAPERFDARFLHGQALERLGEHAAALAEYDRLLAEDPGRHEVRLRRAAHRLARGDAGGAVADWDHLVRARPDDPAAWSGRALAREARGDRAGALADYDAALAVDPGRAELYLNRGDLRRQAGDLPGARADLEAALARRPDLGEAHAALGLVCEAQADWAGAVQAFRRFLALRPGHPEVPNARRWLARCEARLAAEGPR